MQESIKYIVILLVLLSITSVKAQSVTSNCKTSDTKQIDSLYTIKISEIQINVFRRTPAFYHKISRLQKAIMVCYPIARSAELKLAEMRDSIKFFDNNSDARNYVKHTEKELQDIYTPILKQMSFYQGAVLLKLIDRQTGATGYELLKELKSGISAFFWQFLSRMYGVNLKLKYDPDDIDYIMEKYVLLYEMEYGIVDSPNPQSDYSEYEN